MSYDTPTKRVTFTISLVLPDDERHAHLLLNELELHAKDQPCTCYLEPPSICSQHLALAVAASAHAKLSRDALDALRLEAAS